MNIGPSHEVKEKQTDFSQLNKIQYVNKWSMNLRPFLIPCQVQKGYTPFFLIFEVSKYNSSYFLLWQYIQAFAKAQQLEWKKDIAILDLRVDYDNIMDPYKLDIPWTSNHMVDSISILKLIPNGIHPSSSTYKGFIVFTDDHSTLPSIMLSLSIGSLTENKDVESFFSSILGAHFKTQVQREDNDTRLLGIVRSVTNQPIYSYFGNPN
jgi:hypothetical protein